MSSALLLLLVVGGAGQAAPPAAVVPVAKSPVAEKSQGSEDMDEQIAKLRKGLKAEQASDRLKALIGFARFVQKRQVHFPVEVVPDLLALLDDPDASVRPVSIKLLSRIPAAADQTVPEFEKRLEKIENVRGADGLSSDLDRDGFIVSLGVLARTSPAATEILANLLVADAALANLPGLKTAPKPGAKPLSKQDEAALRETTAASRAELGSVLISLAQGPRLSVKYLPALLAVIDDKTVPGRDWAMVCIANIDDIGRHVQAIKALKTIRDTEKSGAADYALNKIKEATEAKANAARGGK